MNTTTERDRNDFVIAVSPFIDEYGLDPMEYRLYSHIVRRAGKEGCFESIPNMARICLMNEKTVRKTLRVLIAAGLIQIAQQRQGKTTIYQITHSSEWVYSEQLKSIRQRFNAHKVEQNLLGQNLTPTKLGTTNHDTPTKLGTGSSTKSGRGVVPNLVDEVFPIKEIPIKQSNPPTPSKLESECDEISFSNSFTQHEPLELPPPESLTPLFTKPDSSLQPDKPSCRPTIAAVSFDKAEQSNKTATRSKFQSIGDLINQVLLDPGIMASDPLPAVYKSEIKLRGWRFPWRTPTRDKIYQTCDRRLVELIAKERAKWSGCEWTEKIPTVIKSIGNLEGSKAGLEELMGYWSKVLESDLSVTQESQPDNQPIGYFSNRSLDWHKATFCELLDLADRIGTDHALAQFTTRYDQQHTGATDKWLEWLKLTHPKIYAHLHQQAA